MVLAAVASWLAARLASLTIIYDVLITLQSYARGVIPEAVLYLQRISDPRVTGSGLSKSKIVLWLFLRSRQKDWKSICDY